MQTILVQILIGLAQITMAAFGGFLVERHIITGTQEQTLIAWVMNHTIIISPILAALAQLNVAMEFVQTLFTGIVIAVALAIGLAFGLGGQSAAARFIDHFQSEMKN